MTRIDGAVVLVTGASRGLGHELVGAFLAGGAARIYAAVRSPGDMRHADDRVQPIQLDVTSDASIAACVALASDTTVLVNNAGINRFGSALSAPDDDILEEFRVNTLGPLNLIRAFAPGLAARHGAVVDILSICSLAAMSGLAGYSASKAAMYSLHESLRPVLKLQNITSHAVFPGPMNTEMNDVRERHSFPPPAATAAAVVAGILRGDPRIFPDARAEQVAALWHQSPLALQNEFDSFL